MPSADEFRTLINEAVTYNRPQGERVSRDPAYQAEIYQRWQTIFAQIDTALETSPPAETALQEAPVPTRTRRQVAARHVREGQRVHLTMADGTIYHGNVSRNEPRLGDEQTRFLAFSGYPFEWATRHEFPEHVRRINENAVEVDSNVLLDVSSTTWGGA